MIIFSNSEADTENAGFNLAESLAARENTASACIIALRGGLGAGKTAFTRGLAQGLGIAARVTSPTFTIVNEYDGTVPLFHFDVYRLTGSDDLFELGFDDYIERGGIIAVEWSELIADALPPDTITVTLEHTGDTTRKITIEGGAI